MTEPWWSIDRSDTHCHKLTINHGAIGTVRRVLLLADLHWDSAHCLRDELAATLAQAKATGSPVLMFGDIFDAMQGKWDPRASADTLRPEHRCGNYLDSLVDTAAEWFTPYADVIALMSYGNHETSVKKRHEVDLLQRLVGLLRSNGSRVVCAPYWGYVMARHLFAASAKHVTLTRLLYHHGYGGGGEVTRGMIDHSRTQRQYEADIYVSGHIHRRNVDENIMIRLTSHGNVEQNRQLFLRCGAWKDESGDGWHTEKGRAARPHGGWWLEFQSTRKNDSRTSEVSFRAIPT